MVAVWEVVGGGDKGGIVVRVGKDVASAMASERLSTGALLQEVELDGERLHYERLAGSGPAEGWVSLRLQSGKDLVLRATGIWEVVGGGDKGGIVVRTGKDKSSPEAQGRLSCGALVREVQLEAERLQYKKLTGTGPDMGWVSTQLAGGKDLLVRVGGETAAATPVSQLQEQLRDHHDAAWGNCHSLLMQLGDEDRAAAVDMLVKVSDDVSLQHDLKTRSARRKALRLLGALGQVEALAGLLDDEDLAMRCEAAMRMVENCKDLSEAHVGKLAQLLMDKAWRGRFWGATLLGRLGKAAAPAKDALEKALDDEDADVGEAAAEALQQVLGTGTLAPRQVPKREQVLRAGGPVAGRRPRILAVHGTPANSAVMQMQTAKLKVALGKEVEWKFVDSPMIWQAIPGSQDPLYTEPSDLEKQLAKGKPFLWWYMHGNGVYGRVDEGVANLRRLVEEAEPVDVIVAFSQGSNCVSLLLDALRREGTEVPWKLSVFFCGGQIDDEVYRFKEGWKSSQPTLRVFNGSSDAFFGGGEISLDFMYSDIVELGHSDGHAFPSSQPRAGEIYAQVAQEIRRHCGLPSQ